MYNLLQFKSNNTEDRLIGYKQVSLEGERSHHLLIHTVLFVYCIEPASKDVRFVLDKSVYFTVSPGKSGSPAIRLKFRDFREVVFGEQNAEKQETVTFSTLEDFQDFQSALAEKR